MLLYIVFCLKQNLTKYEDKSGFHLHLTESHIGVSVVMMSWTIMAQEAWGQKTSFFPSFFSSKLWNFNADHEMWLGIMQIAHSDISFRKCDKIPKITGTLMNMKVWWDKYEMILKLRFCRRRYASQVFS